MTAPVGQLLIVVDRGSIRLAKNLYRLTDDPFFVVNKARTYTKIRRTGAHGCGGPEWEALKACEASVRLSAAEAVASFNARRGAAWPTDKVGYRVELVIEFGDRVVPVRSKTRRSHTRTDRARVRQRKIGLDKAAQAVLDGLQGPVLDDDERIDSLEITKTVRSVLGELGDRLRIRVVLPPGPAPMSREALEA